MNIHPWNQGLAKKLAGALNSLPHALLLAGPPGLGKADFAQWLAGLLLCAQPTSDHHACGQCHHCQLFHAASHPDMHVVEPESLFKNNEDLLARYAMRYAPEDKGRETRASTVIRVDQVRALIDVCQKRPQTATRKVMLLCPAEALNTNAANSLLKILEEPPADSLFLLVTHQRSRLPATILSRCVRMDFTAPDRAEALSWLTNQGLSEGIAAASLSLTGGAPLEALRYSQSGFLPQRMALIADLESLLTRKDDAVSCALRWKAIGAGRCLSWLQGCLADLATVLSTPSVSTLRNPDMQAQLQAIQKRLNLKQLFHFAQLVGRHQSALGGALDEQLILDDTLSRWTELGTIPRE